MKLPVYIDLLSVSKVKVLDLHGGEVLLSSFWKNHPAILVFIRHFGCSACRGHAFDVWSQKEVYQKNGARIIFIGNGPPLMIEQFKSDLQITDAPLYVDPSLEAFKTLGFKYVSDPYAGDARQNIQKYVDRGFQPGDYKEVAGNGQQLGGIIAIKPGNQVAFHYIMKVAGDYPAEITSEA